MSLFRCVLLLMSCLTPLAPLAQTASLTGAPDRPLSAVIPFEHRGVDSSSVQILVDALGTELLRTGTVRVMERSQMDRILAEQGFQHSGACVGGECAVEMGQLLGIDQMVVGSVGRLGNTFVISARMVSVQTGEVLASSSQSVRGVIDDVLSIALPRVAADLTGSNVSQTPTQSLTAPPPPPTPVLPTPNEPVTAPAPTAAPVQPIPQRAKRPVRALVEIGYGATVPEVGDQLRIGGQPVEPMAGATFHLRLGAEASWSRIGAAVWTGWAQHNFDLRHPDENHHPTSFSLDERWEVRAVDLGLGGFVQGRRWRVGLGWNIAIPVGGVRSPIDSAPISLVPAPNSMSDLGYAEQGLMPWHAVELSIGWRVGRRVMLHWQGGFPVTGILPAYDDDQLQGTLTAQENLLLTRSVFALRVLL